MQTEEAMKCEVPCPRPAIAASLILPAILILLFLTLLTLLVGTILRLFILLFLYFKLFVVL